MAALVGGLLYKKQFKCNKFVKLQMKYSILLDGIWNNKTSWKFLNVSKTRITIGW